MMNKTEIDIIVETAIKIKNGDRIYHQPVNFIKGKSLIDLYLAGYIYKKILAE